MKLVHAFTSFYIISLLNITCKSMDKPEAALPKHIDRVIAKCLKDKTTEIYYNYRHIGDYTYQDSHTHQQRWEFEDQTIRLLPVELADTTVHYVENYYAGLTPERQVEYVPLFVKALEDINALPDYHDEKEIKKCIRKHYNELKPLVWRVHLLWLLRQKHAELFETGLNQAVNYFLQDEWFLKSVIYVLFPISLYKLLFVLDRLDTPRLAVYWIGMIVILAWLTYDISKIKKALHKELKHYNVWKTITDELAQEMEKTYRPL